jgi:hypothetical protein
MTHQEFFTHIDINITTVKDCNKSSAPSYGLWAERYFLCAISTVTWSLSFYNFILRTISFSCVFWHVCLIVYNCRGSFSVVWQLSPSQVTLGCKFRAILNTCGFYWAVRVLLCATPTVARDISLYGLISQRQASSSHCGIQTCNLRIIRTLHRHSNHCDTWVALLTWKGY